MDYIWHIQLPLRWRHNGRNSVSNHQPHDCLLKRLFRHRSKKTSKLHAICAGNSSVPGEFPAQMASNAEKMFPFYDVTMLWGFWLESLPDWYSCCPLLGLPRAELSPRDRFHAEKWRWTGTLKYFKFSVMATDAHIYICLWYIYIYIYIYIYNSPANMALAHIARTVPFSATN